MSHTHTHTTEVTNSSNFKHALYNCLCDALSDNSETRRVAEERIKAMEITQEYGIHLIEISLQKDISFIVRQMSSVVLKQYIDAHWASTDNSQYTLSSFVIRGRIRDQLLEGLKEPNSKIRNAFAYCISSIGCVDFPNRWPSLFDDLHDLISVPSYNKNNVAGVIRVYEDIVRESDGRMSNDIYSHLIEQLCRMLDDRSKYDTIIRMNCIHVLSLILNVFCAGREQIRDSIEEKLGPLCEYFLDILRAEDKVISDYGLKTNIIRFLTLLVQKMSRQFAPYLSLMLPTVWGMVMNYGDTYTKSVIYSNMFVTELENDEGKVVGFTPLVLAIFDFIHSIVDCTKLNRLLSDVLPDILYYVLIFMQITKKMEENWLSDPILFVEDDSNESFDTKVRVTARDVLMMICHDFDPELLVPAFCHALRRHLTEAENSKTSGTCYWWKVHEVCMFALGLVKNMIISHLKAGTLQFGLTAYIDHWQMSFQHPELSLLLGRTLWFSGKFSAILPVQQHNNYMQTTLNCLRHTNGILKMFALRTIIAHCEDITENPNKSLIVLSLPTILECLLENLTGNLSYLFILSLTTLKITLSLEKTFTASVESRITPIIINIFLKHNSDPDIVHEIRYIIKEFCLNPDCILNVQEKFVPIIANILNSTNEKIHHTGLKGVAMDVLQTIVKCSKSPLSDTLILIGYPATIKCILHTDDQMVLLSGGECLRSYLLLGAEQICNYSDTEGTSGLEYILRAISQLLDPLYSEEACKRIGRLIITLINKAGSILGSSIHFLLRAILSKMQRVEQMEVWQSLLIVFVYLFYTQLEAVISFLTSIPGPTGASALEFVLIEWLNRESYFNGYYERVVSIVALTKLLEYSVTFDDKRFDNIMVRDELISKIVETRKEQVWSEIPLLGKAFKIVMNETAYQLERSNPQQREADTNDSAFSDEEEDDDDETLTSQISDYMYYDTDPDQQDLLYAQDPIFQIDILNHLTEFLHKFKSIPRFHWFVNYLNSKEKDTLTTLGICVTVNDLHY